MTTGLHQSPGDLRNTMRGWAFSAGDIESAVADGRMLNPSLDLWNACDLNCAYCFIEEKNTATKRLRPDDLTIDEIRLIIEDFAKAGAATLNIVGAGEPTRDPRFFEVLRVIHSYRITPVVFTHGATITKRPEILDLLEEVSATVVVKYNSRSLALQDLLVRKPGYSADRDRALGALLLRGFAAQMPTRLAIDTIAFRGNLLELPAIHRWARENGVFPITADFIPTGRTAGGTVDGVQSVTGLPVQIRVGLEGALQPLSHDERAWLYEQLRQVDSEFGIAHSPKPAYYGGGVCTQSLGVYVDSRGWIWPCVAREQIVGGQVIGRPLGSVRGGLLPSSAWREHPYMASVRRNFDGGCPYKPCLTARRQAGDSHAEVISECSRCQS